MGTSQRVSRGFHRLGLFLAAVLLLVGEASALQYQRFPLDPPLVGITATGPIVPGDFDRLSAFIKTLSQSGRTLSFFVDSPGGNLFEAGKIAAFINKSAAAVTIPSGSQCSSACFLLFAAAAHRFMAPDALIGVHSSSYGRSREPHLNGHYHRVRARCGCVRRPARHHWEDGTNRTRANGLAYTK